MGFCVFALLTADTLGRSGSTGNIGLTVIDFGLVLDLQGYDLTGDHSLEAHHGRVLLQRVNKDACMVRLMGDVVNEPLFNLLETKMYFV